MNDTIALPAQPAPLSQGTAIEQTRAAAEVAAAVSVARNFPRDQATVNSEMGELCSRLPVAERAFYEVENRGAGLSIHIARELARIFGNLDYGVRELRRDDEAGISEMQAWAWDQQNNVRNTRSYIQPHARMARGQRKKLTDLGDIYLNNQNTGARAVRECIFAILPGSFLADAEQRLKSTLANGDGKPLAERVDEAVAAFDEIQVTLAQLETRVEKPKSKWGPGELVTLRRIYATVTLDGIPMTEFFPQKAVEIPVRDPAAPVEGEPV